jgi:hypothetical protein
MRVANAASECLPILPRSSLVPAAATTFSGHIARFGWPNRSIFFRILAVDTCLGCARLIHQGLDREFTLGTSVVVLRPSAIGACLAETARKSADTGTGQQADNLHRDDLHDGH